MKKFTTKHHYTWFTPGKWRALGDAGLYGTTLFLAADAAARREWGFVIGCLIAVASKYITNCYKEVPNASTNNS